ncbi:MAG: LamG domain-containing protein [Armatimonadetes bacterium]|nr:LamG domain-containing protein [Armatimonadota bacterium]
MDRALVGLALVALICSACHAAESGLIAHWNFDQGSGEVARDVTGNGHDAALKNVEWVPSPRGYALRFDSRDDLARYGQVETMNLSGDMTLAVWVKTDSSVEPKTNRILFGDGGAGVERNMNLRMDGYGYLRFEWADGTNNASLLAPSSLLNGSWKHVVVSADSGARLATMYVDGKQVAQMQMPLPISKAPVRERLTGWFYNGYFQGELDDIRLYSRALPATEITALYQSQADVEVGTAKVLYDGSVSPPVGRSALTLRNWSRDPRRVRLGREDEQRDVTLAPGEQTELEVGQVALTPAWTGRTDLFICGEGGQSGKLAVSTIRGDFADVQEVPITGQLYLEPLQVHVHDPWRAQMPPGKTQTVRVDLHLDVPRTQLAESTLSVRLVSRETGKVALVQAVEAPDASLELALDTRELPWGAYDATFALRDKSGSELASTKRLVTVLPGGAQQIRVLNNLVSELVDAQSRDLLGNRQVQFMNPRDGWVWFSATGQCSLSLGDQWLLSAQPEAGSAEAMRLLPAGKHTLTVTGVQTGLIVRAIPALLYNVFPSGPQIAPFGSNTWERLARYTLPNTNMIEGQVIDTPEYREWVAQGKMWIANLQAPGLIDKEEWTAEKLLNVWLNPRGWDLAKIGGIQVDEYYPGNPSTENVAATTLSIARLSEAPAFAGKLWIPFVVNMHGNPASELFMKTTLGCGWPFSIEVYAGEEPTEERNLQALRNRFLGVANDWERAYPGCMRRAIFTPMYAYLPYCTTNRYPQADFRVHLDMQMEILANDPALFGLWGIQPYRSNYVDEEILNCMGRMLRHYCIEGQTRRMLDDPYELRHVTDPDFEEGTEHWQVSAAEEGSITGGKFPGYGMLQGRYPPGAFGDTFAVMIRSARAPNTLSQQMKKLERGRLYSVKVITGDYADLTGGKSRKDTQVLSIAVDGAQVLEGGFSYPFRSARGPQPFTPEQPFWMTYHWLQFRAQGENATLRISDWAGPDLPGGPVGQQMMVSFIEVQPVLESP